MRFLFVTLDAREGRFYLRVSRELAKRGHEAAHLTWSPLGAADLRRAGFVAHELPALVAAGADVDVAAEARRIESAYDVLSLRDVYRTDRVCEGRPEAWCLEQAVRQFRAV